MADNLTVTQGSGTTIAADDIGGVLYQRVKATHGADGSATDVSSASPMPVTLANTGANATPVVVDLGANNDVTVTGTVAVTQSGTWDEVGINDSGNSITVDDGGLSLTVDGTVAATQSGTWTLGANSGVDIGDVTINNASGASAVNIQDGGNSITVDGTVTANAGTGTFAVSMATNTPVGNVAHDAADSGAPIKTGGRARTSDITSVANDDRVDSIYDKSGRQIVFNYCLPENLVSGAITTAMTGTTSTSLIAAPGAGLYNYITQITVSNAHATVGTDVALQDGNAGTTFYTIPAAALYGGAAITFNPPLRQPTSNTALYCVNVTTGASTKVSASGFKGS